METPQSKGKKFERWLAKNFNLSLTPGSGATWGNPADLFDRFTQAVWWRGIRVEAKATGAKQYTLRTSTLSKVTNEANLRGELPILAVELGDGTTWGIMDLESLMQVLKELSLLNDIINAKRIMEGTDDAEDARS